MIKQHSRRCEFILIVMSETLIITTERLSQETLFFSFFLFWMQQPVSVYTDDLWPNSMMSENTRSAHICLRLQTGKHGSVVQLNPAIVSLLEVLGRSGQGPFIELLTVYTQLSPQGLFPKL